MSWDEALATLDIAKLRRLIDQLAGRAGLLGYTVDSLLVDTLWEAWRCFDRYDPNLSAFQTWTTYLLRHTIDWHRRQDARTMLFSQAKAEMLHAIFDTAPTPEEIVMRREEIAEAQGLVQRIEIAVDVLSRKRTRRTNLAVLRTYRHLLMESGTVKAHQSDVARWMGVSPQTVSVAMKRIADICRRCGLRV